MAKQEFSTPALMNRLVTEHDAYLFLEELRWASQPVCHHCGSVGKHYYLKPQDGTTGRRTRTGANTQRRVWKCRDCRKQFSVLTGTIFHGTKISIRTWVLVIAEVCTAKNGISAREVERKYDLTAKTAWFMLHRIREAMKRDPMDGLMRGTIVSDETWIGGDPQNRHEKRGMEGRGHTDKQPVMALVDYETREVRSRAIPNVTGKALSAVIADEVEVKRSQLWTDELMGYRPIGKEFNYHYTVNHKAGEYERDGAGTNLAEGYFSQLKRSIDGTFHHVSVEHLDRYLAQFDFMYTLCKMSDSLRVRALLANTAGRRLSYKPLTESAL